MIVDSAVEYIYDELKYEAKRYFIDRYNAKESEISSDGFTFSRDSEDKIHQFKAISNSYILKLLNDELQNVAMATVPLKLLERKGQISASVLRVYDKYWIIRVPAQPMMGDDLDIDDGLAQVVVYKVLVSLGINRFMQVTKEIIEAYNKAVVIPDPFELNASIAIRFSNDGNIWHDSFQTGDNYWSVGRDGIWGSAIPLITSAPSGGSEGGSGGVGSGVSKFTQLTDTPTAIEPNKMLVGNSAGTKLEFREIPTPPPPVSGNGGTEGVKYLDINTASKELDLSGDDRVFWLNFDNTAEIAFKMNGYDLAVVDGATYTLAIMAWGYGVTFGDDVGIIGLETIDFNKNITIITVMALNGGLYVTNQKEYD